MTNVAAAIGVSTVLLGQLFAVAHLVGLGIARVRDVPRSRVPARFPWGYIGVGSLIACTALYAARGLATGAWGWTSSTRVTALVLGVASWGFGAAHDWVVQRRSLTWQAPLVASSLSGAMLGLGWPVVAG